MDAEQFLARVVPPGNYIAIAYKGERGGMSHRFFARDDLKGAGGFIRWTVKKGIDVWHACASFKMAEPDGKGKGDLTGARTQENAQALKSFWIDLDIKRAGDGKKDGKVYPDLASAVTWLKGFCAATQTPLPNLWVHSGWGLHLYWVLEDAVDPATWRPYAEALKGLLIASGMLGDLGVVADTARILRPVGGVNFKDRANPKPVVVLKQSGEIPNQEMYDVLEPYIGLVQRTAIAVNYGSDILAGAPPSVMGGSGSLAAAQANLASTKRPFYFAEIAKKCEQVKRSLSIHGDGDGYDLWYRGHLTLSKFCADGDKFVHEISSGDPRYDPANVDAHAKQAADEIVRKNLGAPTCASYDSYQPGVCGACPYRSAVSSPFTLGTADDELPAGYRRHNGTIQRMVKVKDAEDWVKLIDGNIYDPILDRRVNAHILTFTYELAGHKSYVIVDRSRMPTEGGRLGQALNEMGIDLHGERINQFMGLIVAWITKLRQALAVRDAALPPFGWARDASNQYIGFAVGGTLYRSDGTQEPAPGGDPNINEMYRPRGDLQAWKDATAFVLGGRPDLQILAAAAFGAPLMEFTGQTGVTMTAWSRDSGVGKSSAIKAGQSVWGIFKAMCSMHDTHNAARQMIAKTRVMPCYWDEMRIHTEERAEDLLDLFFEIAQGKDKARLHQDTSIREIGEWKTLLVATSNRSFMDHIERDYSTDAGALRCFEFQLHKQKLPFHAEAPRIVASLEDNAGQAGRVYAEFIAKCRPIVEATLKKFIEMIQAKCNPVNEERLYIAGMACVMTGAQLAHHLGLVDFDRMGMLDFLVAAFEELRRRRTENLTVANGVTDLDKILGNFFADHAAEGLVTNEFHSRGRIGRGFKVLRAPNGFKRLAFHIGQKEQVVRIDKVVWEAWARSKRLAPDDTIKQILAKYGGQRMRAILGGGTDFASGRVDYFEVPLTAPELVSYNYDFGSRLDPQLRIV